MNREWKSDKLEYSNTDEPTNLTTSFERENLTTIVENRVAEVVRGSFFSQGQSAWQILIAVHLLKYVTTQPEI